MVTMKSAPAAHSLADVAGMPPAALSLCIASALRLREARGVQPRRRRRSPEVETAHGEAAFCEVSSHWSTPAHTRQTLRRTAGAAEAADMFPSPMKPTLLRARVTRCLLPRPQTGHRRALFGIG